jgi:hypothetical protein
MRATASPCRFFKIRHDAGSHFRAGIMDSGRNRLRTKYLFKINWLGVEATSGIEPEYTVLQADRSGPAWVPENGADLISLDFRPLKTVYIDGDL